ncbi:MAG: beta-galactosidase [Planctomycetota bacterium]
MSGFCLRDLFTKALIFLLAFSSAYGVSAAELPSEPLLSFEATKIATDVIANGAEISLISESSAVTEGAQAIQVICRAKSSQAGVTFQADRPWDWGAFKNFGLALDIANTGDYSTQVYVALEDHRGKNETRTASIPAESEARTYYLVLHDESNVDSGMRDDPPRWNFEGNKLTWLWGTKQLDLSNIRRIKVHTGTIIRDRAIAIDNVRLIGKPGELVDHLTGICDQFGQNAHADFPLKIHSDSELKSKAAEELSRLAESHVLPDRSKFGGWKTGPRLEATGYFRTEKVGDRWSLVDPEGYLFFSTGIANARMANTATMTGVDFEEATVRDIDPEEVTPEDSKGFVQTSAVSRRTKFIASELRHQMFEWLPSYDDPLSDNYTYVRSVHSGPVPHGEAFSFYQANLERRYGEPSTGSHLAKWRDVTVARMLDWGFTSMGNWTDTSFYQVNKIPYFANGWIIGDFKTLSSGNDYWSPMPDPYDPEFVRRANVTAAAIADEVKGNPWCVGIFIDNEKGWGRMGKFASQYGIVINAMTLDSAVSPTKAAFIRVLREKYGRINDLNSAWGSTFSSWEELATGIEVPAKTDAMQTDFSMLLHAYACEYFKVVEAALHEVLPNHMYMGVRMAHWGLTPEVVNAAKKHSDVISYNFYKEGIREEDWPFLPEVDMPSIIGEFHMGSTSDTGLFHPGLIAAADQADRGRMFKEYMESVIDNPYFVGAHWFQYIDSPLTGRSYDGENYNVGFVTITDIPYPDMVAAAKALNRSLYERRYGKVAHSIAVEEEDSQQ